MWIYLLKEQSGNKFEDQNLKCMNARDRGGLKFLLAQSKLPMPKRSECRNARRSAWGQQPTPDATKDDLKDLLAAGC